MTRGRKKQRRTNRWLLAIRPKTLPAAIAPVIMGTAMAIADGGFHPGACAAAIVGALLLQIGANFANDYFDFKKGADVHRQGPVRVTQAGLVSEQEIKQAVYLIFFLCLFPLAYLAYRGGSIFIIIGLLAILCAILYTGGPHPLGYLGLGDIFVFIFFGPVALAGTYYTQTLQMSGEVIITGYIPGLLSVAILTANNLRDCDEDQKVNKKTLAVRFGKMFARCEYTLCLILGFAIAIELGVVYQNAYLISFPCLLFLFTVKPLKIVWTGCDGLILNSVLAKTGAMLFFLSLVFSMAWIIQVMPL